MLQCHQHIVCTAFWDFISFWYSLLTPFSRSVSDLMALSIGLKVIFITEMQELFVADSESSSIRVVNLKTGGSRYLAGGDPVFPENLFRVFVS